MTLALKVAPATIEDLLAIPEQDRFHEIIGGELVQKAMPSAQHGSSQANLAGLLVGPYGAATRRRLAGRVALHDGVRDPLRRSGGVPA
jgi:Uma2 family endonuclease